MIWDALRRLWRSMLQRVRGIPRSLLPSGDDDVEDPIPLTWRATKSPERDAGPPDRDETPADDPPPLEVPAPPMSAVSAVPTLRPMPSGMPGMPSRKPRRPGR